MHDADVLVLGAGPAGVAAAVELRRLGRSIALVDPGRPPAWRIETLPANGIALAEALGLGGALAAAALGRAAGMRMSWRETPERRDYGRAGPLLLDRPRLHAALRAAALAAGATVIPARAGTVREHGDRAEVIAAGRTLAARVLLDARGRAATGAPTGPVPDLVALPFHGRGTATERPRLRLDALEGGWSWACRGPGGLTAGALFLPAAALAGADAAARRAMLAAAPDLERAAAGRPAAAEMRAAADPLAGPQMLMIGDRALARDPIASHGLVHALRSGAQAAAVAHALVDPAGAHDAARAFLRDRHAEAARGALAATAAAYAAQAARRSAFWERAGRFAADPPAVPAEAPAGPLALAAALGRAAVLEGDALRWGAALLMPASGRRAAFLGPFGAARLAALLDPPAPLAELARRLGAEAGPDAARLALATLVAEGALAPAVRGTAPRT